MFSSNSPTPVQICSKFSAGEITASLICGFLDG